MGSRIEASILVVRICLHFSEQDPGTAKNLTIIQVFVRITIYTWFACTGQILIMLTTLRKVSHEISDLIVHNPSIQVE